MNAARFDNLAGMNNINTDEIWDLVIGGERVVPGGTYEVIDPNTTQVVGHAPEATAEHACQLPLPLKRHFRSGAIPIWQSVAAIWLPLQS